MLRDLIQTILCQDVTAFKYKIFNIIALWNIPGSDQWVCSRSHAEIEIFSSNYTHTSFQKVSNMGHRDGRRWNKKLCLILIYTYKNKHKKSCFVVSSLQIKF